MKQLLFFFILSPLLACTQTLTNTTNIDITKTWFQEPNGYTYPIFINVPNGAVPQGGFPVCILLHGNGGNGQGMVNQFSSKLNCHAIVAPSGYLNSWNISDENSEAPDMEMINELVDILQGFENINPNKIRVLGFSNGAALANRIFIENDNEGVDMICSVVSQLSEAQYHNGNFYGPSGATGGADQYDGYDLVYTPIASRKYLNVCNENDPLIPYAGGPSVGVNFLHAQDAIYFIAQNQGYTGDQISGQGTSLGDNVNEYSYLSGQVVHLNGLSGHSMNLTQENYIISFLKNCDNATIVGEVENTPFEIFPNPTNSFLSISGKITKPVKYEVISVLGQVMIKGSIYNNPDQIDLSQLPANIYHLKIGSQSLKIIKLGN